MSLVDMDISHSRAGIADMVFDTRGAEAFTGDVSMPAGGFPIGLGFCGLAFGPGCLRGSI